MSDETSSAESVTIPPLAKPQRRILGTLIEKACTTPEYYPLTLKALTTGCNQKNNRDPVTNYPEEQIEQTMDSLQRLGLTAVVHTSGGRTERYRHLMRQVLTISEPQLAILAELLLRGRQQLGELRSRASRMRPIETQEDLKTELEGLISLGLVKAGDDLNRRGVEVDHCFYPEQETSQHSPLAGGAETMISEPPVRSVAFSGPSSADNSQRTALSGEHESLKSRVDELENRLRDLEDVVLRLRSDLGH